jgi:hypothetical protein
MQPELFWMCTSGVDSYFFAVEEKRGKKNNIQWWKFNLVSHVYAITRTIALFANKDMQINFEIKLIKTLLDDPKP